MRNKFGIGVLSLLIFLCGCTSSNKKNEEALQQFSEYEGRYALTEDLILDIKEESGLLTLLPSFWHATQILDAIDTDSYEALLHPRMKFEFKRDSTGQIVSLESTGNNQIEGTAHKLRQGEYKPVELILDGKLKEGIAKLNASAEELTEERVASIGFNLLRARRSQPQIAFDFVSEYLQKYPSSIDLYQIKGLASLLLKDRESALLAFQQAFQLDSTDSMNAAALRLLQGTDPPAIPKNSWKLPFTIEALFEKPTQDEIAAVRKDWENRDLRSKNYQLVQGEEITLGECTYALQMISHEVYGQRHLGAVLIPEGAKLNSSPVILELRGVNPRYSAFQISKAKTPKILEANQEKAIILIPSFRGNTLIVKDQEYTSEGVPNDAWDGAADDAIAFLNVVLDEVPQCDSSRISVFGKSRGGTVAMLVGIRDDRINGVVNWAGPSGWYRNMGTFGWTIQEQLQWALWERWAPGQGWGSASQFIDHFLLESQQLQKSNLESVRHKILASSPLYFLESLPTSQMHYGVEDSAVPIANAVAIQRSLDALQRQDYKFEIFQHANTGHDQPYPKAYQLTYAFFAERFQKN